jgi:replicative DNA helicase
MSIETGKKPPYSLTIEQAVIASIMSTPDAWDEVSHIIGKDDFYSPRHRTIYATVARMYGAGKPVDPLTVLDALRAYNLEDMSGGENYLGEVLKNSPSSSVNAAAYAKRIREYSIQRSLLAAAENIMELVQEGGHDTEHMLQTAEKAILGIIDGGAGQDTLPSVEGREMALQAAERIEKAGDRKPGELSGLPSGITRLDEMTDGFQPGDLIIIAARPSMGKTTLAMNFCQNNIKPDDFPIVIFSMEQPQAQLVDRLVSSMSGIPYQVMKRGQMDDSHWPRVSVALADIGRSNLIICDKGGLTPEKMAAFLRRVKRERGGVRMIMADYLQKMHAAGYGDNRNREIGACSGSAKEFAKEYACPFLMLSQLSKRVEQRPNKRPMMSDLRDSGEIEQDADMVIMPYRDEVYNPDSTDKGTAELIVTKSRNGEIGVVKTAFRGDIFRFSNLAYGGAQSW